MQVLRRMLLSVCAGILGFSLVGLAWSHSLSATLRNQETVKSWLADSGLYDELGASVVEQIAKESDNNLSAVAQNEEVKQIATDALGDSNVLRSSIERLIDNVYVWLNGGELPQTLQIDFADASQRLSEGLGDFATRRAAELPVCTPEQTLMLRANFDVWTAPCRPAQLSAAQIGETTRNEISSSIGTGQTDIQTSEVFDQNNGGNPPEEVRKAYQRSRWLPFVFTGLAVASALGLVFASSTRLKGLGRAGWVIILSGLVVSASALFISKGPGIIRSALQDSSAATIDMVVRLFETAGQDIARILWWYGAGFIVIGLAAAVVVRILGKPSGPGANSQNEPQPPIDDSPKTESDTFSRTPTTQTDTSSKSGQKTLRPPRKIQL